MVLAGCGRGHGDRVLEEPWERVYDDSRGPEWTTLVRRREGEHRARLCSRLGAAHAGRGGGRPARRERGGRREVDVTGTSRRKVDAVRRGARPRSASSTGDTRRDLHADGARRSRSPRTRARISAPFQVPIFSGFAAQAIAQRLQDAEAKVLLTASHSYRRGRELPMRAIADEAVAESPSVEHVVEWDRATGRWDVELGPASCRRSKSIRVPVPPDLHLRDDRQAEGRRPRAGGFLVSIAREAAYQADGHSGDVILFATDMGWIMGPWTVVGGGARAARSSSWRAHPTGRTTGSGS